MAEHVVRRRADGFAVWNSVERLVVGTFDDEGDAEREADRLNGSPPTRTYGLTYYVEVEAASPSDAIKASKRFFAPSYRQNWDPVSVEVYDAEHDAMVKP